jgi:hypothetical protein
MWLNIIAIIFLIWAGLKVIDLIVEMFAVFGGDGVQPYDIVWWISHPISIRGLYLFEVPMLAGVFIWIFLICGTYWAVTYFI